MNEIEQALNDAYSMLTLLYHRGYIKYGTGPLGLTREEVYAAIVSVECGQRAYTAQRQKST